MCTVTFLPSHKTDFILTSNRDESPGRKKALPPQSYLLDDIQVVFPKDVQANGTWIVTSENGFTVCLLNGAFEKHIHTPPYRLSRGLMLLDFFKFNNATCFAENYDFTGIEPFTLLIINHAEKLNFTEIRWDESGQLYVSDIDTQKPHIWSSATLYPLEIRQQREKWFADWLADREQYELDEILHFHHFGGTGNKQNDLLMNRNLVTTVSITAIVHKNHETEMVYEDLLSHEMKNYKIKENFGFEV